MIGNRLDAISKKSARRCCARRARRSSPRRVISSPRSSTRRCRLVAQTAYIPVLMGALPYALRSIAKTFEGDIDDGDSLHPERSVPR